MEEREKSKGFSRLVNDAWNEAEVMKDFYLTKKGFKIHSVTKFLEILNDKLEDKR